MPLSKITARMSLVVGVVIGGCHDVAQTTAPAVEHDRFRPPVQPVFVFSAGLGVTGSTLALPTYNFPEGVKVEIKIEGETTVSSDPAAPYINAPLLTLDAKGVYVAGAYNSCYLAASVSYPQSPGPRYEWGPGNGCSFPRTMQNYVDTGLVRGAGTAVRKPPIPVEHVPCDTIQCHAYDGGQTISIRPLDGALKLIATSMWNGKSGKTVFVPPFTPSSYYWLVRFREYSDPSSLPLMPLLRTWVKGDSSLTGNRTDINECPNGNYMANPAIYPGLVCDLNVKESGRLVSLARVNAEQHLDTASVQCEAKDSILDTQETRTKMPLLSDVSNPKDPNPNNRAEQVAYILRNNVTGALTMIELNVDSSDQCRSYWRPVDPAALPSGVTLVAYVHTHPQYQREKYACKNPRDSTDGSPGGSDDDWRTMRKIHRKPELQNFYKPDFYIVANDFVYKMGPNIKRGSDRRPVAQGQRWDRGLCKWIRL